MIFGLGRQAPPAVRPLRAEKAEACAALHRDNFAHPWPAEEIAALLASPSALGAAALHSTRGALVGFVLARLAADEAEILTIAVSRASQGRGVGAALMREILRQAANAGAKAMFLEVDAENVPAIALYRRHGFAEVGKRPGYYRLPSGARATALVMRKTLA
jgi:[ribosomal protein S18]-alanine N-acetyltransferase